MKTNIALKCWPLIVAVTFLLNLPDVNAQTYTGIDLYTLSLPFNSPIYVGDYPSATAGGQVVGYSVAGPLVSPHSHALLWSVPVGAVIDLTPTNLSGFTDAAAYGTNGAQQVGEGTGPGPGGPHALLWNGSPDSAVDLHPTGLSGVAWSFAYGIGGGQQVGEGRASTWGDPSHALLWSGTAESAVDLHPTNLSGFENGSVAYATDGTWQVGAGHETGTFNTHALLWNGTADSAVDLHPTNLSGISTSVAYGVSSGQQVGSGLDSEEHRRALLWSGTAVSAVDLHPANLSGFINSTALSTNGVQQVGTGGGGSEAEVLAHALLWSGTAESAVDLNGLLPFNASYSVAYTIDAQGNVFGIAADASFNLHAVEWLPIPEPPTLALAALGILALLVRKGAAGIKLRTLPAVGRADCF